MHKAASDVCTHTGMYNVVPATILPVMLTPLGLNVECYFFRCTKHNSTVHAHMHTHPHRHRRRREQDHRVSVYLCTVEMVLTTLHENPTKHAAVQTQCHSVLLLLMHLRTIDK